MKFFKIFLLSFFFSSPITAQDLSVLAFDGIDNSVSIDNITTFITGDVVSIEIRFKTSYSGADEANPLLSFRKSNNSNLLKIGTSVDGGIYLITTSSVQTLGVGYNDNKWHLLSLIAFGNGTAIAYIDGVASLEFSLDSFDWSQSHKCSIGADDDNPANSEHFNGFISELRIWDKQLTIQDIDKAVCEELTGDELGLISLYNFTDSKGKMLLSDRSINKLDGTIFADISSDWKEELVICDNTINDLLSFTIVGDAPYDLINSTTFLDKIKSQFVENNEKSYADFLIHVGDIKKQRPDPDGSPSDTYCADMNYYLNTKTALELSKKPTTILIGDNEWNDCRDITPEAALVNWNSTFEGFTEKFKNDIHANVQAERPENISFIENSVLFITINYVGGRIHDITEWNDRLEDNKNWISENMLKYKDFVHSSVIFAHAAPNWAINSLGNEVFYDGFKSAVKSFSKPTLYIQGDAHIYTENKSFDGLSNLTRVIIASNENINDGLLQVVLSKDIDEPFFFDRKPFANGLTEELAVEIISTSSALINWITEKPAPSIVRYGKSLDNLKYKKQDLELKINHSMLISNLINSEDYIFEVGTRTSKLFNMTSDSSIQSSPNTLKNVYPNPSSQLLNFDHLDFKENQTTIWIYDTRGKLVLSDKNKVQLNISELASGTYILRIYDHDEQKNHLFKIIKI